MPVAKATPRPRKPKPRVKYKTVTVTFKLPEAEVQDIVGSALMDAADRRYGVKKTFEIT